ncbi:hypothetical protein HELRODRAFT_167605 [Helobdella robusta]|uniref:Jacalin-type lectin domain-containing protein n=1 Tax=Helobdella robusta TaxID=6412 RepID=T1EZJ5_HELRO|nr:hypothetical protein HELRODRAFT_167605 [Helobdella robusta]ESO11073.1 hypothetical protein HELRODRAFT_167605 [Helobdella robusta]
MFHYVTSCHETNNPIGRFSFFGLLLHGDFKIVLAKVGRSGVGEFGNFCLDGGSSETIQLSISYPSIIHPNIKSSKFLVGTQGAGHVRWTTSGYVIGDVRGL